jgi:hypothetical protein
MDPYLEDPAFWADFHATFINYWREALADVLPDSYDARITERINLVEVPLGRSKSREPDITLTHQGESRGAAPVAPAGAAVLEPVTIPLTIVDEQRETYIEVLHRPGRELVAVLELLSPANKEEPGRAVYLAKRNALLLHLVHLVELDLLLKGQRPPFERDLPEGDYFAFVSRADRRPNCDVYAWALSQPLPLIPIPLLSPDPDVWVDLAAVCRTAYERGRFGRSLDYKGPPPVRLAPQVRAWVEQQARGGTG